MREILRQRTGTSSDHHSTTTSREGLRPSNRRNDSLRPGEKRTTGIPLQDIKRGRQRTESQDTLVPNTANTGEQHTPSRLELKRGSLTLKPSRELDVPPQGGQKGLTEQLRKDLTDDSHSLIAGEDPTRATKFSPGDRPSTTAEEETADTKQLREKFASDPSSDLTNRRGAGDAPEDLQAISSMKDDKKGWVERNLPEGLSEDEVKQIEQESLDNQRWAEEEDRRRGT